MTHPQPLTPPPGHQRQASRPWLVVELAPAVGLTVRGCYPTRSGAEHGAEHWSERRPHGYFEVLEDTPAGWRWPDDGWPRPGRPEAGGRGPTRRWPE